MFDKLGRETVIGISVDMDLQDNMKWSIEKPTPYSWRLRIRGLEVADEGNYTCFVVLTSNNNRVMSNRTVIVTGRASDGFTVFAFSFIRSFIHSFIHSSIHY